jgi:hypothetical protein
MLLDDFLSRHGNQELGARLQRLYFLNNQFVTKMDDPSFFQLEPLDQVSQVAFGFAVMSLKMYGSGAKETDPQDELSPGQVQEVQKRIRDLWNAMDGSKQLLCLLHEYKVNYENQSNLKQVKSKKAPSPNDFTRTLERIFSDPERVQSLKRKE